MRLFLDANVIFTAAHNPGGRAAAILDLARQGRSRLVTSQHAVAEARKNVALKHAEALPRLDAALRHVDSGSRGHPGRRHVGGGAGTAPEGRADPGRRRRERRRCAGDRRPDALRAALRAAPPRGARPEPGGRAGATARETVTTDEQADRPSAVRRGRPTNASTSTTEERGLVAQVGGATPEGGDVQGKEWGVGIRGIAGSP